MGTEIFHQIHAGDPLYRHFGCLDDRCPVCQKDIKCIQQTTDLFMVGRADDLSRVDRHQRQLSPFTDR